jgi:uncharacterized protein YegP (UPF0339 family)
MTTSTVRLAKLEKYVDSSGGFRWRLLATNGKIIADSAEAYVSAYSLDRAVTLVLSTFEKGVTVVSDKEVYN